MAIVETSQTALLSILLESLTSTTSAFPSNEETLLPPADGISLVDIKNELLLSYLQNLVFLIILRLRNRDGGAGASQVLNAEVVKKLVESRVYLEKGVRPLEARLKYQIDKVLRAAEDADRNTAHRKSDQSNKTKAVSGSSTKHDGSNFDSNSDESDSDGARRQDLDDLSYRPNPAALLRKPKETTQQNPKSQQPKPTSTGPYKPPRITPTAMPSRAFSHEPSRKRKSHLLDEYIDAELSTAPQAQPSIGSNSTILNRGRSSMSARERAKQQERTEYEERNLTRLPTESKAERRKARLRGEDGGRRDMFGGEDWTGLGGLGDRVARSVSGKRVGRERGGVLERREKRRATEDGPRGDGVGIGESFETRKRVLQGRAEKKMKRSGK